MAKLSNARKAEIYGVAARRVEQGWGRRSLSANGNVCLAGAINYATSSGWSEVEMSPESKLVQRELAERIFDRSPLMRLGRKRDDSINLVTLGPDSGGLETVELWNDTPWRRRRAVLGLLRELEAEYREKAREDELRRLQRAEARLLWELAEARDRIVELEREVARLREEAGWWKRRALERSEREIFGVQAEMGRLDEALELTRAELERA